MQIRRITRALDVAHDSVADLPHLEGVNFRLLPAGGGRSCWCDIGEGEVNVWLSRYEICNRAR